MVTESHIQAIARFLIGFGTEEDDIWRDYNLDFCTYRPIVYDANGIPVSIDPVDNSGYSLGSLQWDFGQGSDLATPFIQAFQNWMNLNPQATPLVSTPAFAIKALTLQGPTLKSTPSSGLRKQDVQALSEFVRSDGGSDWVNTNIDNLLIGSDQQSKVIVGGTSYGLSLVAVARAIEPTATFKKFDGRNQSDITDLLYAIGMKAYNQNQVAFTKNLLPFLGGDLQPADVLNWCQQLSPALKSGVGDAVMRSQFWTKLISGSQKQWLLDIQSVMASQSLANPCVTSKTSGAYLVAKQVFEDPDLFGKFVQAIQANTDFVTANFFDAVSGAIALNATTGRLKPGLMVKKQIAYAWDASGNAYKLNGNTWSAIPIKSINIKQL
jgi:hypothetical protein